MKQVEENTLMLINRASKLFRNYMRNATDKLGLNDTYRPLVMILNREDNLTQLELAKKTNFSAPSISLSLQKMELEGLIERKVDDIDKRQTRIFITEKGRSFASKIIDIIHIVEEEVFKEVNIDEQMIANEILKKIINKLEEIGGINGENI